MTTPEINYFGIQGFKQCPVNVKTKTEFSKILFLYPRLSAYKVRVIGETYNTEETIECYLHYLTKDIARFDSQYIRDRILLTLPYWIENNGFLTMLELLEVREYCGLDSIEYLNRLCETLPDIKVKQKDKWLNFLRYYSKFVEEKHIDIALDSYLTIT